jgi:hypothetical protein
MAFLMVVGDPSGPVSGSKPIPLLLATDDDYPGASTVPPRTL